MAHHAPSFLRLCRYRLEWVGLRVFLGASGLLGIDRASGLFGKLARFVGPLLPINSRARRNLKLCLPELNKQEHAAIIRDMWENLGRTVAEYAHWDAFDVDGADGRIEIEGRHVIEALHESGESPIFTSGHFANWELLPLSMRQLGFDGGAIYRAPNNPYIDELLTEMRARFAMTIQVPKGARGSRAMVKLLRGGGGALGMLADQKLNDGIEVPFFGRPAMTTPAPAQLALRYGCPIVLGFIERLEGARFCVHIFEPLRVSSTPDSDGDSDGDSGGDVESDVVQVTARINKFLEEQIRARPGQWLWLHNRWPGS